MDKEYFLRELEFLLSDIAEEERQEALEYYRDYLEEAGPLQEQEVLRKLGRPEKVAAQIIDSLQDSEGNGAFTEQGYRDEWYEEEPQRVDHYTEFVPGGKPQEDRKGRAEASRKRRNGVLLLLLFLIFGLPAAGTIISAGFSVILGIFGGLFGVFAGLIGLVIGGFALTIGLLVTGLALIISGFLNLSVPAFGVMAIGGGFLVIAAALLLGILTKWGCTTVIPGLLRGCIDATKKALVWIRNLILKLRKRGGAGR